MSARRKDAVDAFLLAALCASRGEFDRAALAAIRGLIALSRMSDFARLRAELGDD